MSTEWTSGTGSALLHRELVPMDLSDLVPAPRRGRSVVPDRAEPLDVRLHAPTPEIVIVRVIGALHPRTCAMLVIRVRQQLHRAHHVILDLSSVTWVDLHVALELRDLHAQAASCGARLHVAAESERVVEGLRRINLGERVVVGTADTILSCIAPRNG